MKTRTVSFGLLILRIGIGGVFVALSFPDLIGGVEKWEMVGSAMSAFGINSSLAMWGFLIAFFKFAGGILLILGLFLRPASIFLASVMFLVTVSYLGKLAAFESIPAKIQALSHSFERMVLFVSLAFVGAGRFSLDEKIFASKKTPPTETTDQK